MLNDVFLIQLLSLVIIFFLYWTKDVFTTILLGTFYLFLLSSLAFIKEADIVTSFLIIIDLGVFLVLLSFLLHFTTFLKIKIEFSNSFIIIFKFLLLLPSFFIFFIKILEKNQLDYINFISKTWFFFINYFNYYSLFNTKFNNDLQILKEVYFYINNFEFFVISIGLYLAIVVTYFLLSINVKLFNYYSAYSTKFSINKADSNYFFRYQNFIKQNNTQPNLKVWNKNKKW